MLTRRNEQGAQQVAANGGMMDEAGQVVNGVEVPAGSLTEEVADDVPAMLSEGEFVVPADVVRYVGLERLMKMRDKAKEGLERMEEMGQMGNAEEVENPDQQFTQADDIEFENEIDSIVGEVDKDGAAMQTEQMFAAGGYVTGSDISKAPQNPAVDVRYYKHADGRVMYITFINDKPMTAIPEGFSQVSAEDARQVGRKAEVREEEAKVTAAESSGDTSGGGGVRDMGMFPLDDATSSQGDSDRPGAGISIGGQDVAFKALNAAQYAKNAALLNPLAGIALWGAGKAAGSYLDNQMDKMSEAYNAVAAPPALPGMGTFAAKDGSISTISTQDMINKSDMDMFGVTSAQLDAERAARLDTEARAVEAARVAEAARAEDAARQAAAAEAKRAADARAAEAARARALEAEARARAEAQAREVANNPSSWSSEQQQQAAETGMVTVGGVTVSNDATIAAQNEAMFGDSSGGDTGGSSKIVCTAMNESYGFGSFRQSIWLRYSAEHMTKEHEVGYHAMFLPLVKAAYKEQHWYSQSLRSVLEHIARHRTADIRAELRGSKRNRIGQAYRVVLEPLCYIVGKLK